MRRFRVNVLTGFIACGLLCLNLGGFVFSNPAELPAASYDHSAPVDSDDADDAGRAISPTAAGWNESVPARQERRAADCPPDPSFSGSSLVTDNASLTWHFAQRAAAAPRAPSFRA